MFFLVLFCILLGLLYHFCFVKPHQYWKRRGIPHEKPVPLFGSYFPVIQQKMSIADLTENIYNKYRNSSFAALYMFNKPTLILRDPELIRKIAIKEFDSFSDHNTFAPEEGDPIWSQTLFAMPGGTKWKNIRSILSPAYTTNKLKIMFGLIVDCAQQFAENFSEDRITTLEMKETFEMVTTDIISTTAFGVECNTVKNPNNEMFETGKSATMFDGILIKMVFFISAISETLARLIKVRFISEKNASFFRKVIKETIAVREERGVVRPDMIHLMLEAKKGRLQDDDLDKDHLHQKNGTNANSILTDDVIIAQAVVFFFAGFDTMATAMSYVSYELAVNPKIQNKLMEEIDEVFIKQNNKISYEALIGMKYLDMVISETLRKWPPFAITDRKAVHPITLHLDSRDISLDENVVCQIPIFSIHRDPKYYPNPEKFDPERFNDENKQMRDPLTYLPFGVGPRNCIGMRFAIISVKTVLVHLLRKFKIVPVEKTAIPIVLSKTNVNPVPSNGYWLALVPRKLMCNNNCD